MKKAKIDRDRDRDKQRNTKTERQRERERRRDTDPAKHTAEGERKIGYAMNTWPHWERTSGWA